MKNKVLLIDDDETLCELGKEMFEILNVEAFVAQTIEEAEKCFKHHFQDIALVIFDLNLDDVTGLDVFDLLKTINDDFVAILASGIFIDEDAPKYIEIGFKEIILKPYNLKILKEIIGKYL